MKMLVRLYIHPSDSETLDKAWTRIENDCNDVCERLEILFGLTDG